MIIIGFLISLAENLMKSQSKFEIVTLFPHQKGRVMGLVISGVALNVLFWSTLIIKIVNPKNLKPNDLKIFPKEVADNFTQFILIFNMCNLLMGLIGTYLLRDVSKILNFEPGSISDEMISNSLYSWES